MDIRKVLNRPLYESKLIKDTFLKENIVIKYDTGESKWIRNL
jgi:hypothetical protein